MLNNKIFIISGPSGVGKNSVVNGVKKLIPELEETISCTTREPRPREKNNVDYYFLTKDEFKDKVAADEFLEHFEVHGMYYGTLKSEIKRITVNNKIPITVIDVQGALHVKKNEPNAVLIFIKPDSWKVLEKRLNTRKTNPAELKIRIKNAQQELVQAKFYDYQLTNYTNKLKKTVQKMANIVKKEAGIDK